MCRVPVQAGGESATRAPLRGCLTPGSRVVVGTVAVENPEVLVGMVERWPGQVLVGLDHRSVAGPAGEVRREVAVRAGVSGGLELEAACSVSRAYLSAVWW